MYMIKFNLKILKSLIINIYLKKKIILNVWTNENKNSEFLEKKL